MKPTAVLVVPFLTTKNSMQMAPIHSTSQFILKMSGTHIEIAAQITRQTMG